MTTKTDTAKLKRRGMRASSNGTLQLNAKFQAPRMGSLPLEWAQGSAFVVGQGELRRPIGVTELPGIRVGVARLVGSGVLAAGVGDLGYAFAHMEQKRGALNLCCAFRLVQHLHVAGREVRLPHEHMLEVTVGPQGNRLALVRG